MPFRHARYWLLPITQLLCILLVGGAWAEVEEVDEIKFRGDIKNNDNLSAIARLSDTLLIIGADEIERDQTNLIQLLEKSDSGYKVKPPAIEIGGDQEMDIEALAVDGQTVYVIGSHALVRKKVDVDDSYQKNRKRLAAVPEPDREFDFRNSLVRLELKPDGTPRPGSVSHFSLRHILDETPPFSLFRQLPSKENGVDIEGLALRGGKLYAGFRAPVLRGNYVPVLEFELTQTVNNPRVLYVNLCGKGIRDLVAVQQGFLILAGPMGDSDTNYSLYRWDGRDVIPGNDHPDGPGGLEHLGDLPKVTQHGVSGKAEGLALVGEDSSFDLLVVFDGLKDGGARRYRVSKHGEQTRCQAD
jgi:hypothetical protein